MAGNSPNFGSREMPELRRASAYPERDRLVGGSRTSARSRERSRRGGASAEGYLCGQTVFRGSVVGAHRCAGRLVLAVSGEPASSVVPWWKASACFIDRLLVRVPGCCRCPRPS